MGPEGSGGDDCGSRRGSDCGGSFPLSAAGGVCTGCAGHIQSGQFLVQFQISGHLPSASPDTGERGSGDPGAPCQAVRLSDEIAGRFGEGQSHSIHQFHFGQRSTGRGRIFKSQIVYKNA